MTLPAKAGIGREDIGRLVEAFYGRVRADERLGPIFAARIGTSDSDWTPHLNKIEAFWANVMLNERAYRGNPMQAHRAIPDIEAEDFTIWLDLFSKTATDILSPEKAAAFDGIARRIGRSLKIGIERTGRDAPPNLTT